MPRANRYHIPGLVWHITHRCHKREFLLKFARDRRRWQYWLFEARKRFGLRVLNYAVTSNHIHLLIDEGGRSGIIAESMQLIAGRTGQEFNKRKGRRGAFWEDRYHATAVDSDEYLRRCMAYIDLNMVRAGVVDHPSKWLDCGYGAIQEPPQRYRVIDVEAVANRMGYSGVVELQREQRRWIEEGLGSELFGRRDPCWTESLAVGGENYVDQVANELGMKSYHKQKTEQDGVFMIRESQAPYNAFLGLKTPF